ncbi:hypothetical protein [Reticulibacter mediterranei]|nr:hypothetical protein [Reticulibacter mediterranei]
MSMPSSFSSFNQSFIGYDDPWVHQDHYLPNRLQQAAPRHLIGGRSVLWCCSLCSNPWYEAAPFETECPLSPKRLRELSYHLGVPNSAHLPAFPCPRCSVRLFNGLIRAEASISAKGAYRFLWMSPRDQQISCLYLVERRAMNSFQFLKQPYDVLCPAALRLLMQRIAPLAGPMPSQVAPVGPRVLMQMASAFAVPAAQEGSLCGYYWLPQSFPEEQEAFMFICATQSLNLNPPPAPLETFDMWLAVFDLLAANL